MMLLHLKQVVTTAEPPVDQMIARELLRASLRSHQLHFDFGTARSTWPYNLASLCISQCGCPCTFLREFGTVCASCLLIYVGRPNHLPYNFLGVLAQSPHGTVYSGRFPCVCFRNACAPSGINYLSGFHHFVKRNTLIAL